MLILILIGDISSVNNNVDKDEILEIITNRVKAT